MKTIGFRNLAIIWILGGHSLSFADTVKRIRPKMMTVLTTFMALIPILLASSANSGADVMKRMAAPMVGGIFTSFLLELLVYLPSLQFGESEAFQIVRSKMRKYIVQTLTKVCS